MEQFRTYSPEDIILSNLNETAERHATLFEQELAHIAELVREWTQNDTKSEEFLSSLHDIGIDPTRLESTNHLERSFDILQKIESVHTIEKNILLSREIAQRLSNESIDPINTLLSDAEAQATVSNPNIHYQKNSFTDTAYLQFAKLFQAPRARYTHSYQSSCEDVFNRLCEYCILPLENTSEGRMVGFLKLIDRYDLKVIATCEIIGTDSARSTTFALLGKQIERPMSPLKHDIPLFFEMTCRLDAEQSTAEWLTAAGLCDLQIARLHTIPDGKNEQEIVLHTVFKAPSKNSLATFLVYLAIKMPQFTPIGFYPHLSLGK